MVSSIQMTFDYLARRLMLRISSVANLTSKLKSVSRCFLQNLKTLPHCLAGKFGLWIPWKILATARPLQACSA